MKMNLKVRLRNPYFWIFLGSVILTAMGATPETFTNWSLVKESVMQCANNPFKLGSVAIAIIGVFFDPTTKGLKDSSAAMTYEKPKE